MLTLQVVLTVAGCIAERDAWSASCDSACEYLYAESECDIQIPARERDELLEACRDGCSNLYGQSGSIGDYDPSVPAEGMEELERELENQAQAEAWLECVSAASCDEIDHGYCPPLVWD